MAENNVTELTINTGSFVGSIYSNAVNVTVTDFEMTFEFLFIHPRDAGKAQVVSRITVPLPVGTDLPRTINTIVQVHSKKKGGVHND